MSPWRSAITTLHFSWRQTRPHWRLLLALGAGLLLSVSLVSQTPIYFRLLEQSGLRHTIDSQKPTLIDLQITSQGRSIHRADYEKAMQLVESNLAPRLGFLCRSQERSGNAPPSLLQPPGSTKPLEQETNKGYMLFRTSLEEHVIVQKGRMPVSSTPTQGGDIRLEGVIGSWAARLTGLDVGSRFTLIPFTSDPSQRIQVEIVGIIEPRDFGEEYWVSNTSYFLADVSGQDYPVTLPIFITEADFFQNLGKRFPTLLVNYWWDIYIDGSKINADNYREVRQAFKEVGTQVSKVIPRTLFFTGYDNLIQKYEERLFFLRAPLTLVVLMVEGLIFYYLWTVSSAMVQEQQEDMARIKSRGGSTSHILSFYLSQGLVLVVFGFLLGPPLSLLFTRLMGRLGAFSTLTPSLPLTGELTLSVYGVALLAAIASLAAILIPGVQASRKGMVEYKATVARPAQQPWLQRGNLDLAIIALGFSLYWFISSGKGFISKGLLGGFVLDYIMLFSPALLLVVGVLLFLRVFPLLVRTAVRLVRHSWDAWALAALRHLHLEPISYFSLIALLILATSVGTFAASFGKTLERNYDERAPYEVGTDVRLEAPRGWVGDLRTAVPYLPEAKQITFAYRKTSVAGTGVSSTDHTVLAIEPEKFPTAAWFREDFAQESLRSLMWTVQAPYAGKLSEKTLPGEPRIVGVWVSPKEPYRDLALWIRLRDSEKRYYTYIMGGLNFRGWRFLQADLLQEGDPQPAYPLKLASIYIAGDRFSSVGPTGSVALDDLQIVESGPGGQTKEVVDGFTDITGWQAFPIPAFLQDSLSIEKEAGGDGSALLFSWLSPVTSVPRGIFSGDVEAPIPVVASQSFIISSTYRLREPGVISLEGRYIPIVVRAVVDYFPTLDPSQESFMIADIDKLEEYLKLLPSPEESIANEAWISFSPGTDREEGLNRLTANIPRAITVLSQDQIARQIKSDPLGSGGWASFLSITYASLTIVIILAVTIHGYLQARQRRVENSVLKLWGLPPRHLLGLVLLENTIVLLASFGTGILLGSLTGLRVTTIFNFTERGFPIVPPLVLTINWQTLLFLFVSWLGLFLLSSMAQAASAFRASVATTLRLAE